MKNIEKHLNAEEIIFISKFIKKEGLEEKNEETILWQLELALYRFLKKNKDNEEIKKKTLYLFIEQLFLKLVSHHEMKGDYSKMIYNEMEEIKRGLE